MVAGLQVLKKIVELYGWRILCRLPVYPLVLLVTTPLRLLQTLWAARSLAAGRWSEYNMFNARMGLNHLFYWTQAVNLDRYGRDGISPVLGLGKFPLAKLFHLSLPSTYLIWNAGAVLPLASMLAWLAMHLTWLDVTSSGWLAIVLAMALISTQFYAGAFAYLNYNAFGWIFFPLGLWGWQTSHPGIATLAWLAASFGSYTVVAVAGLLSLAIAAGQQSLIPLLTVVPAVLKLASHFLWLASPLHDLHTVVHNIAKVIGATKRGVLYTRRATLGANLETLYFLSLYILFALLIWLRADVVPTLWLAAMLVYAVNALLVRFADPQNMHMMQFSVATALTIQYPDPVILAGYWLIASPLPRLLAPPLFVDHVNPPPPDRMPALRPFLVAPILARVRELLAPVAAGQRVLAAFDDPQGHYQSIFDGYRVIYEAPLHIASCNRIHLFPDWYAVMATNFPGAPVIWGRDIDTVSDNATRWQASFVLIYQQSGNQLDDEWEAQGFRVVSTLDWAELEPQLGLERPWEGPTPQWWLLSMPQVPKKDSDDPSMNSK